ncbi:hypothetical protein BH09PSE4_BH09PSE4_00900 [soil metagenome]
MVARFESAKNVALSLAGALFCAAVFVAAAVPLVPVA